eukprot:TRINITY_DN992_c0_g1_i4.p1 TRINITY_DN992_c0_g1~~TRINITY_DN992_c0_g1_i4.p1  ORF type:complete len:322 (+),score=66.12 TRINITY_DN992_c0_g1_i4:48-1013(+)
MPGVALGALRTDLNPPQDTDWVSVGRVEKLYLYPVKSLAHIEVTSMDLAQFGGYLGNIRDRQFMVTDLKGKFVTSRRYPNMSLIQPKLEGDDKIILSYPGKPDIQVKINPEGETNTCEVWGDGCQGVDLGDEAATWLSDIILQKPQGIRFMYHKIGESSRPDKARNEYLMPLMREGDKPLYADGCPYLLLSQASVQNLNKVLKEKNIDLEVEETRFRPNIHVTGDFSPHAEDQWSYVKIGNSVLRNIKPCTRCVFTTVDPKTGTKDKGGNPLKTLREYRSTEDSVEKKAYGTSPFFGVNMGLEVGGRIETGMEVMVRKSEA